METVLFHSITHLTQANKHVISAHHESAHINKEKVLPGSSDQNPKATQIKYSNISLMH